MKKTLLLSVLAIVGASVAQAETRDRSTFNFSFLGNYSGNYTMVACDYAEAVAQEMMEKLGAKNVEITCNGGITSSGIYPLNLRAEYDAGAPSVDTLTIESSNGSNCVFDTELVSSLVRELPGIRVVSKSDSCFSTDSSYSYKLDVTGGR